jgi:hypothetical protein
VIRDRASTRLAALLGAMLAVVRSARARYFAGCLAMCAILVCFVATFLRLLPREQASSAVALKNDTTLISSRP